MPGFAVDSHPDKNKIVAWILAGRPVRVIAESVSPKLPFSAVQRYKSSIIKPVLQQAENANRILISGNNNIESKKAPVPLTNDTQAAQATQAATQIAPGLSLFRSRLEKLHARTDRALDKAESGSELGVMAPLLNVGLKATEMLGRATGELEQQGAAGFSIQILCPANPAPDDVRVSFSTPDAIEQSTVFEDIGLLQKPT